MYKLFKSKKAIGIDDFLPLLFAFFISLFFALFLIITEEVNENSQENNIVEKIEEIKGTDILLNFLNHPVSFDMNLLDPEKPLVLKEISVSDLITFSIENNDYTLLKKEMETFFDPLYFEPGTNSWKSWEIKIELMPDQTVLLDKTGSQGTNKGISATMLTEATIPISSKDKYLSVKLFKIGRGTAVEAK